MWTRDDNTWKRYKYNQTQRRFKENYFDQILLFQKCVNAVTYMPVDNLENIYNTLIIILMITGKNIIIL